MSVAVLSVAVSWLGQLLACGFGLRQAARFVQRVAGDVAGGCGLARQASNVCSMLSKFWMRVGIIAVGAVYLAASSITSSIGATLDAFVDLVLFLDRRFLTTRQRRYS